MYFDFLMSYLKSLIKLCAYVQWITSFLSDQVQGVKLLPCSYICEYLRAILVALFILCCT